jgi:hypothetical protein
VAFVEPGGVDRARFAGTNLAPMDFARLPTEAADSVKFPSSVPILPGR